jgi:hypothetical protein
MFNFFLGYRILSTFHFITSLLHLLSQKDVYYPIASPKSSQLAIVIKNDSCQLLTLTQHNKTIIAMTHTLKSEILGDRGNTILFLIISWKYMDKS